LLPRLPQSNSSFGHTALRLLLPCHPDLLERRQVELADFGSIGGGFCKRSNTTAALLPA
jgi:hypothetical protein